eukprot:GHVN01067599.1.p1 GENE.GHVN01067599.1~~GHVN01067599.1.p1  ORF type:complete len:233 (+),score=20.28 GHVN01067599.1:594-1292(+)
MRLFSERVVIEDPLSKEQLDEIKTKLLELEAKHPLNIKITTGKRVVERLQKTGKELQKIFSHSILEVRDKKELITDVFQRSWEEQFTHVILLTGERKKFCRVTIICNGGPTLYFKVLHFAPADKKKLQSSSDALVLFDNFTTNLGTAFTDVFRSLFPPHPSSPTASVAVNNQRDFILIRKYSYKLYEGSEVMIDATGPSLDLRLLGIQSEVYRKDLEGYWKSKKYHKRLFYL